MISASKPLTLNLNLHRYHVVLEGKPRFFFANLRLAMDTLRTSVAVRKAAKVEIIDGTSGKVHYSNGYLQ